MCVLTLDTYGIRKGIFAQKKHQVHNNPALTLTLPPCGPFELLHAPISYAVSLRGEKWAVKCLLIDPCKRKVYNLTQLTHLQYDGHLCDKGDVILSVFIDRSHCIMPTHSKVVTASG